MDNWLTIKELSTTKEGTEWFRSACNLLSIDVRKTNRGWRIEPEVAAQLKVAYIQGFIPKDAIHLIREIRTHRLVGRLTPSDRIFLAESGIATANEGHVNDSNVTLGCVIITVAIAIALFILIIIQTTK